MWSLVITGITKVVGSWFDKKEAEQKAEANYQMTVAKGEMDWDTMAQRAAQFSWKDEFITIIWFSPLIVAWFYPEKAQAWVDFVGQLPVWYQFGMFGIIAASFGLRWYFKQQQFKISDNKKPS